MFKTSTMPMAPAMLRAVAAWRLRKMLRRPMPDQGSVPVIELFYCENCGNTEDRSSVEGWDCADCGDPMNRYVAAPPCECGGTGRMWHKPEPPRYMEQCPNCAPADEPESRCPTCGSDDPRYVDARHPIAGNVRRYLWTGAFILADPKRAHWHCPNDFHNPAPAPTDKGERGFVERINGTLRRYLPESEKYGGPVVHRDFVADAFAAGMRAAVSWGEVPDDEVADAFEEWCEQEFTE
jgi:hypothetical protein